MQWKAKGLMAQATWVASSSDGVAGSGDGGYGLRRHELRAQAMGAAGLGDGGYRLRRKGLQAFGSSEGGCGFGAALVSGGGSCGGKKLGRW